MNSGDRIGSGEGDESEASGNSGDFEQEDEDEDGSGSASNEEDLDDREEMAGEMKSNLLDGNEGEDQDDYDGNFEEVIVREPTVLLSCLGIGFSNVNRKVT